MCDVKRSVVRFQNSVNIFHVNKTTQCTGHTLKCNLNKCFYRHGACVGVIFEKGLLWYPPSWHHNQEPLPSAARVISGLNLWSLSPWNALYSKSPKRSKLIFFFPLLANIVHSCQENSFLVLSQVPGKVFWRQLGLKADFELLDDTTARHSCLVSTRESLLMSAQSPSFCPR